MSGLPHRDLKHASEVSKLNEILPSNESVRFQQDVNILLPHMVHDLQQVLLEAMFRDLLSIEGTWLNQHVKDQVDALHDVVGELIRDLTNDLSLGKLAHDESIACHTLESLGVPACDLYLHSASLYTFLIPDWEIVGKFLALNQVFQGNSDRSDVVTGLNTTPHDVY